MSTQPHPAKALCDRRAFARPCQTKPVNPAGFNGIGAGPHHPLVDGTPQSGADKASHGRHAQSQHAAPQRTADRRPGG